MVSDKILLIMASPRRKGDYINHLPPLGILYLAARLEEEGFSVDVLDENVSALDLGTVPNYGLIGFSVNVANIENSRDLISRIHSRYPNIPLIVGGSLPTVLPELFFSWPLQAVFISESEESLPAYVSGKNPAQGQGYYFRDTPAGTWSFTGHAPYMEELDRLPFPSLQKVPLERYYTPVKRRAPVASLISSRGCPFTCAFCSKTMGSRFRARSAENVVKEIEWQTKTLGVREVAIYDDNFVLDAERAEAVCDLLIRKKIKVSLQLTNGVRPETMHRRLILKMKEAGFWMIAFAPESGSGFTLRKLKKEIDLKRIEECVAWCREAGIKTWTFFMVGFPWEDSRMFKETIRAARRIRSEITHFSNFTPLPGSELYRQIHNGEKTWQPQDINLFKTKSAGFYKNPSHKRAAARGYAAVYLADPSRIINLFSALSPADLFNLLRYAAMTGNIF